MADITPDEGGADLTVAAAPAVEAPITPDESGADAAVAPAPAVSLAQWEIEVETFWKNVFANVSNKVETPIHNYLLTETEALKARLKALF